MSLLKSWLIPGALAVVSVAGLTLYGETKNIEADLTGRALQVLASKDMDWAAISFSGRDATLKGIAPEEGVADWASELLLAEWGVRIVKDKTELLAAQSPYTWGLTRQGHEVTMIGYLPYDLLKKAPAKISSALSGAKLEMSSVVAARGAPKNMDKAVALATSMLAELPNAKAMLIDGKLTISGALPATPEGLATYNKLEDMIASQDLGDVAVELQIAEPKVAEVESENGSTDRTRPTEAIDGFAITKSSDGVVLNGSVPSEDIKINILQQAQRKFGHSAVSDELVVRKGDKIAGLGADDYSKISAAVLQAVSRLDAGEAKLGSDGLSLTGSAFYEGALDALQKALQVSLPQSVAFTPKLSVSAPGEAVDADRCQALMRSALEQNTIFFDSGNASISSDSFGLLDSLIYTAKRCPESKIQIAGHTDSDGDDAANQELSENRAGAVLSYLSSAGFAADRLQAKGFGETQPVASNDTPEGKAKNRRIEFVILQQ